VAIQSKTGCKLSCYYRKRVMSVWIVICDHDDALNLKILFVVHQEMVIWWSGSGSFQALVALQLLVLMFGIGKAICVVNLTTW
jgi:hypothetical protein